MAAVVEDETFQRSEEEALDFLMNAKAYFQHDKSIYDGFLVSLKDFREKQIDICGLYEQGSHLFSDHPYFLVEFSTIVYGFQEPAPRASKDSKPSRQGSNRKGRRQRKEAEEEQRDENRVFEPIGDALARKEHEAFSFVGKVKNKLESPHNYERYLRLLHSYANKTIALDDFHDRVANSFKNGSHLVEGLKDLCKFDNDGSTHLQPSLTSTVVGQDSRSPNKDLPGQEKNRNEIESIEVLDLSKFPKSTTKPIEEVDLFKCQRCTPSYRLLSNEYQVPPGNEVLNNYCYIFVCPAEKASSSSNEDAPSSTHENTPSSTHENTPSSLTKETAPLSTNENTPSSTNENAPSINENTPTSTNENAPSSTNENIPSSLTNENAPSSTNEKKHEEDMKDKFKYEDDLFEVDMLLEYLLSATKSAKEMMKDIDRGDIDLTKKYFSTHSLRFIERMYKELGIEVVNALVKNPKKALPVILKRLEQKKEELESFGSEMKKKIRLEFLN